MLDFDYLVNDLIRRESAKKISASMSHWSQMSRAPKIMALFTRLRWAISVLSLHGTRVIVNVLLVTVRLREVVLSKLIPTLGIIISWLDFWMLHWKALCSNITLLWIYQTGWYILSNLTSNTKTIRNIKNVHPIILNQSKNPIFFNCANAQISNKIQIFPAK